MNASFIVATAAKNHDADSLNILGSHNDKPDRKIQDRNMNRGWRGSARMKHGQDEMGQKN